MKVKFWGVRGSIAFPGPLSVRYGGNTTCIEVRGKHGELIILDAGTGIFPLAQSLLKEMPLQCHLFITHTHWDHIQGLPFFIPIFVPGNKLHIHGAFDPVNQRDIREILSRQMEYAYFPVRESELKADLRYHTLRERESVQVGGLTVTTILMSHPVLNFGYRIEEEGRALFFTGDHEWPYNIYDPEDEGYLEYDELIRQKRQGIIDFLHGVECLIADAAYTEKEYPGKKGWGHGTYNSCMEMAREAEVKRVIFTHHEPTRNDDNLERALDEARSGWGNAPILPDHALAYEGMEILL